MSLHLIACSAAKLSTPAPARSLYLGDLFRKSVAYVEGIGGGWAVLSALHGLVMPDEIVAPYNLAMMAMNRTERMMWGAEVVDRLGAFEEHKFTFLAGAAYREPIISQPLWSARRYQESIPMQGLGIGDQKAWLGTRTVGRPTV